MTAAALCPKCGREHDPARCRGHASECSRCGLSPGNKFGQPCIQCGGETIWRPCKQYPITGSTVCGAHGGRARQVRKAGAKRSRQERAEAEVQRLVDRRVSDFDVSGRHPVDMLLEACDVAGQQVAVLRYIVGELGIDQLWGPDHLDDARPHVATEMLRSWVAELAKVSKAAVDVGIDERRTRLAEAQMGRLAQSVDAGLSAAGLTPEQRTLFLSAFADELRRTSPPPRLGEAS